jgi:TolB-like protein
LPSRCGFGAGASAQALRRQTKPPTETAQPLALLDKPSIAVLPFENMSGDPEQEYFADGMVEDVITGLSRSKSLFVIARHSTFTSKGKSVDTDVNLAFATCSKAVCAKLAIGSALPGS